MAMTAKNKIVDWSEPEGGPEPAAGYEDVAELLMDNAAAWARLEDRSSENAASNFASRVNTGRLAAFSPAGAFESEYRGSKVWVRFVGLDARSGVVDLDAARDSGSDAASTFVARRTARPARPRRIAPTPFERRFSAAG